jgi:hypothetical protein
MATIARMMRSLIWRFVVQRKACSLRDQRLVLGAYSVPADLQNRMGAFGAGDRRRADS